MKKIALVMIRFYQLTVSAVIGPRGVRSVATHPKTRIAVVRIVNAAREPSLCHVDLRRRATGRSVFSRREIAQSQEWYRFKGRRVHQAVATIQTDEHEPGLILETVRGGWTHRGNVLRFAQVKVAAAPEPIEEAPEAAASEPDDAAPADAE